MTNFLITSPSSETVGTNQNDLFLLQALAGVTTFGLEGNDTITADVASAAEASLLNAGAGNDLVNLSGAGSFDASFVFAGAGSDTINLGEKDLSSSIVRGGSDQDTIVFSGSLDKSTINGNDHADFLALTIDADSLDSFVGLGKGADRLSAGFVSGASGMSIRGGAGHDSISLSAGNAGDLFLNVNGGEGFDTVVFEAVAASNLTGAFVVQGAKLADKIQFSGTVSGGTSGALIGGGDGADTITFDVNANVSGGTINGGAGLDSIVISGSLMLGSVHGGLGKDSITLKTYAEAGSGGGIVFGDQLGDVISLGSGSVVVTGSGGGTIATALGSTLGYSTFADSNLSNGFDSVSATYTIATGSGSGTYFANLFNITQDVVTATIASSESVAAFSTNTGGIVTFTSNFANDLTSRVVELDRILNAGQTVAFSDGNSNSYVFIQGGSGGGGTADDLLVKTNAIAGWLVASGGSAINVQTSVAV